MPLHHVLFARLHTQTIWCIFCSPSLAGMRTRIAHSKQPERNKYDALDRSAAMTGYFSIFLSRPRDGNKGR